MKKAINYTKQEKIDHYNALLRNPETPTRLKDYSRKRLSVLRATPRSDEEIKRLIKIASIKWVDVD